MWNLQMKKKQASLNSEVERVHEAAVAADKNAAAMKQRCQRALSKARQKYERLKNRLETEVSTRTAAEQAVERLKEEYEKLQRSTDLRVQQLMMQIRHIEKDKDADFSSLALAKLGERLNSPHKDLLSELKTHATELAALSVG